ncbi:MAG: site-specific DNA-methyltransferase [Betaproteobacteria bacterium]|nr:site-specific DNA-methyltransferase [Betaproteobacteria bacterium]
MTRRTPKPPLIVDALKHEGATRKNIPTAEFQSLVPDAEQNPRPVAYERAGNRGLEEEKAARNRDLDPQLVWRGKYSDQQLVDSGQPLIVQAPPIYIQEKVHPKVLIDDLRRQTEQTRESQREAAARDSGQFTEQPDLFADFNGLPGGNERTEFYRHEGRWQNRMILGDSLQVMASLAEREGLRGKVQCVYFDPPYGIKFNSNFQWSTTSRDVKDGNVQHITREPEQVKAFRDTWRDGIHSYLSYIRDRLTVARDLLAESGSIFVQIGDENVHRVRVVMDEVFGEDNFVSQITVRKTTSEGNTLLGATCDFILWFGKNKDATKARPAYVGRSEDSEDRYTSEYFDGALYRLDNITSSRPAGDGDVTQFRWFGKEHSPGKGTFKTKESGLIRLGKADRFVVTKNGKLNYRRFQTDFGYGAMGNLWADISGAVQSRSDPKIYVVQTSTSIISRCLLLATDPGDLVLDPTCGSGTTAYVAEQWGRRWITIDTSRVALALARARIMGARYSYYLLADSLDGQLKEAEITRKAPSSAPVHGDVRQGFVYERVPHITLKSIANNAEIDVIWEKWQEKLEPLREQLNAELGRAPLSPTPLPQGERGLDTGEQEQGERGLDTWRAGAVNGDHAADTPPLSQGEKGLNAGEQEQGERGLDTGEQEQSMATMPPTLPLSPTPISQEERGLNAGEQGQSMATMPPPLPSPLAGEEAGVKASQYGQSPVLPSPLAGEGAGVRGQALQEWQIPREKPDNWPPATQPLITAFWRDRIARQKEIDASIAAKAEYEYLYDKPYPDNKKVRVAGPFTVESLSPHRVLTVGADDELIDQAVGGRVLVSGKSQPLSHSSMNFAQIILENLKTAGVQQAHKEDKIIFTSLTPWPGSLVCAEGRYIEQSPSPQPLPHEGGGAVSPSPLAGEGRHCHEAGDHARSPSPLAGEGRGEGATREKRAAIFIGSEFGTVSRLDLVTAAREAGDGGFDVLIACAFNYDAHSGEFDKLGRIPVLKARMNADLHMADDLKNTGKGNLFVIFGEPDITILDAPDGQIQVKVNGVDVFHPNSGEVRSDGADGIACWFIDTDYNEESFFVRHAYFLGANDPYKSLKTTLKAEIDPDAWATLNSDTSRPFDKPKSGRIAVKVINHLGDEVMKVYKI